ncbi:unnamed protein product [Somion occarium]
MGVKNRRSLQPLFVPPFLRPSSPANASPSQTTRQRSHSAAPSPLALNVTDSSHLDIPPAIPIASDDKSTRNTSSSIPLVTPRNSPPPDLLDDDPFANLSPGPSVITFLASDATPHGRSRSASLPRLRTSLDAGREVHPVASPSPRSPLAQSALLYADGTRSLSRATGTLFTGAENSLPSTPPSTPRLGVRQSGGSALWSAAQDRVKPAYTRPAFRPRPSLPSLRTLAQAQVVVAPKVRRGRVGAKLPVEPWESQSSDISTSEQSESEAADMALSRCMSAPALRARSPYPEQAFPGVQPQTPPKPSHSRRPSGLSTIRDSRLIPQDASVDGFSSQESLTSEDVREIIDAQTLLDAGFISDTNRDQVQGSSLIPSNSVPENATEPEPMEPTRGVRPSHTRRPSGLTTIRDSRLINAEAEAGDYGMVFTTSPTEIIPMTTSPSDGALPRPAQENLPSALSLMRSHSEPESSTSPSSVHLYTAPSLSPSPSQCSTTSTSTCDGHEDIHDSPPSSVEAHTLFSTSCSTLVSCPKEDFSCDSTYGSPYSSHLNLPAYTTPFPRRSIYDDLASTLEYDYAEMVTRLGPSPTHGLDASLGYSPSQHGGIQDEIQPGTSADTIRRLSFSSSHLHTGHRREGSNGSNHSLGQTLEWTSTSLTGLGLPMSPSSTSTTTTTSSSDGMLSYEPSSTASSEYGHAHEEGETDGYATDSFLSFSSEEEDEGKSVYGSAAESLSVPVSQMQTPPTFEDDLDVGEEDGKAVVNSIEVIGAEDMSKEFVASPDVEDITFQADDTIPEESQVISRPSSKHSSPNISRSTSERSAKRKLSTSSSIQNSLRQLFRIPSSTGKAEVTESIHPEPASSSQILEMLSRNTSIRSASSEVVDANEGYRGNRQRSGTLHSSASGTGFGDSGRLGSSASFRGSGGLGGSGGSGGRKGQDDDEQWNRRPAARSTAPEETDSETDEDETDEYGRSASALRSARPEESPTSSDDDDVPLAQQIPTALKAQKTIRRQVRDELGRRRLEKKAVAAAKQDRNSPVATLEQRSISAREPASQPWKPFTRARTKTLPSNSMNPFSVGELTNKLLSVQTGQIPHRLSEEVPRRSSRDPSVDVQAGPSQSRVPPQPEFLSTPVPVTDPSAGAARPRMLRPTRSFHRPRTTGEESYVPPPLPLEHNGRLGRSVTSVTKRTPDTYQFSTPPVSPFVMRDGGLDRGKSLRSHSRRPSVDKDVLPPTTPLDRSRSTRSRRPSVENRDDGHGATLDRARSVKSHSRRPSVEEDGRRAPSRPPMPPLPSAEVVSTFPSTPPPPPKPIQMWQQRIFVNTLQSYCQVEVHAGTTARDVLRIMESQKALPGGGTNWMMWEVCQDFGMERPIRSYELLSDVSASWNAEKTVNVFLVRQTDLAAMLSSSAVPSSSPVHFGTVQWEYKRGKWQKRRIELREHSLWLSKKDSGKDQTFLCSLANFDAYFVTRPGKAPKSFVFAVKSTDNLSFFENTADYMHTFACEKKDGQALIEKILLARSYVLYQERNVLTNTSASAGGAGAALSRAGTRKGQRPAQPLLNFNGAPAIGDTPPVPAMFEPGSLLSRRT